jgi:hypothetical protein
MQYFTAERLKKSGVIITYLLLIYWMLYIVFKSNDIQETTIILNYAGIMGSFYFLTKLSRADA